MTSPALAVTWEQDRAPLTLVHDGRRRPRRPDPRPLAWQDAAARVAAHVTGAGTRAAVALVGLIGLDAVRTGRGRCAADRVRTEIATRLARAVPRSLVLVVDDATFLVAAPDGELCHADVQRCVDAVSDPIAEGDVTIRLLAAAGVGTGCGHDVLAAMDRADLHLEAARRLGAGTIRWTSVDDAAKDTAPDPVAVVAAHLLDALHTGEIEAHFQPVVDVETGMIASLEALARWTSPALGRVAPPTLIAAAESVGLIHDVGQVVTSAALDLAADARAAGFPDLRVAVNASPVELAHPGFVARVVGGLRARRLPGEALTIELTETHAISDLAVVVRHLDQLRAEGVAVVLDDFGTGHANIDAMRTLPIDGIKLDRAFVAGLPHDPVDRSIVRHVLEVARELGVQVVAEGVETAAQHAELARLGCRYVQGFLYAPARPRDEALAPVGAAPLATRPARGGRKADAVAAEVRRRRAQDELDRRVGDAGGVLAHLPAVVVTIDADARVLTANALAVDVLGLEDAPIPGAALVEHVAPDDRLPAAEAFCALLAGQAVAPFVVRTAAGLAIEATLANCLDVDGVRGVLLVARPLGGPAGG